ncbi:PD-(D/E)XK nuclease family protein [Demequina gelatinilytica]|uniref:PD-(D/E)XK nuclease family protein n=1 Tax=Demequina gelatinilytica TaxID=1638980 RepID=UPI0007813C1C|nr:PD-(D/E)XK nuclease family protein [Demequina gelatinilytica]
MTLDLSFLSPRLDKATAPVRPVNVYDILRDGWRETRVDMTLLFFLDPTERHGLGSIVIDALLRALDGAPVISKNGISAVPFDADSNLGSEAWEIATQVEFIDVYAVNRELGIAIILENKIGHDLVNPLDRYAERALKDDEITTVLVAVLAPERRTARGDMNLWLSRALTYQELSTQIKSSPDLVEHLLSPSDRDQVRSLELLQQFFEARMGGVTVSDLQKEADRLNEWRDLVQEHEDAINAFYEARRRANRLIRDRSKRLDSLLGERIAELDLAIGWESHSGSNTEAWNAYLFTEIDWTIELKFTTDPARPAIYVYDYEGRTYKNETTTTLGLEWTASDEEIANAFIVRATAIIDRVRAERADAAFTRHASPLETAE